MHPSISGDLRFLPGDWGSAFRAASLAVLTVSLSLIFVDMAFRSQLNASYVELFTGPDLAARVAYFMARCVIEDAHTRLLLMTFLVIAGLVLVGTSDSRSKAGVYIAAIVLAQASLVAWNTTPPEDLTRCLYIACRYFAPGLVWGWLYWRHGFVTSTLAHATTHIPFQAGLLWML